LSSLRSQPSNVVWAEGPEKKAIGGMGRSELKSAETLILWTMPPSPEELRAALDKVQPQTVYLFGMTEPVESPEAFLNRLAGLLKYALNRRGGKVTLPELEAATAQRPAAIRVGIQWLVAQGEINVNIENGEALTVSSGNSPKDPDRAPQVWMELQALLAETSAYRSHFKQAEPNSLLP